MKIITTQQLITGKWAVVRTSDENDYVGIVGKKEFDTEKEADAFRRDVFGISHKEYGSVELVGNFEHRFTELKDKDFERRSFYNGWKEGRAELLKELKHIK